MMKFFHYMRIVKRRYSAFNSNFVYACSVHTYICTYNILRIYICVYKIKIRIKKSLFYLLYLEPK